MASEFSSEVGRIARKRILMNEAEIRGSLMNVAAGNPLASENNSARLIARLMAKNAMAREEAETTALGIRAFAKMPSAEREKRLRMNAEAGGPEAVWGKTIDFVGVAFFDLGRRAADAVARVAFRSGKGWGSGFLVADGLFLTNHHVIPSVAAAHDLAAEFEFELDGQDNPIGKTTFAFDPGAFFITDPVEGLDFTMIALGDRVAGDYPPSHFGFCPLSDSSDKHALGEVVNIIQHPNGRYKEVVLRENQLVARSNEALHYVADTEPGSSGSPVFNNQWQPIALHHWGGPFHELFDDKSQRVPREVNEGIRISSIVAKLRSRRNELSEKQRARLEETLRMWTAAAPPESRRSRKSDGNAGDRGPRGNADGSITWTFPLEITVRAPLTDASASRDGYSAQKAAAAAPASPAGEERAKDPSTEYSDRGGYEPGFISGFSIPLPALSAAQRANAARNRQARHGDDPFELKYHHFSVVVNAERKLAFYTASNIDGRTSKYINRTTGAIEPLDPANTDHGLMENMQAEGAEASEEWFDDERLADGEIATQSVYEAQNLKGFPTSSGMARTLRMFQRGHLVRRLDPAWGTKNQASLAEVDTFHFTNCAPQVGFFNMGRAGSSTPGTGGGKLWRAVENLVLRNARNMRTRVTSFSGPIFRNSDRRFRSIKIPGRFFKIAVWADDGGLRSLGMIADQSKVFGVWPEALFETTGALGPEAFQDTDEIERVDDFLTTIADIEDQTGLDFGDEVRDADIRAGESVARPEKLDDVPLVPGQRKRNKRNTPRSSGRRLSASRKRGARKKGRSKRT